MSKRTSQRHKPDSDFVTVTHLTKTALPLAESFHTRNKSATPDSLARVAVSLHYKRALLDVEFRGRFNTELIFEGCSVRYPYTENVQCLVAGMTEEGHFDWSAKSV